LSEQDTIVLTEAGLKKIEDELHQLQTVRRQEVADQIRQAKDLGDVAENTEYETAKTEQAFLEGRISELKNVLAQATVLEDADIRTDIVGIGGVIQVQDLDADDEWEFTMVSSFEADPDEDRISNESPIGEALYHRKVGDVVEADTPAGTLRLKVLSIRRPDA
jgi:transcription elongation factor GreA